MARLAAALLMVLAACTAGGADTTSAPASSEGLAGTTASGGASTVESSNGMTCWTAAPGGGSDTISFVDQTEVFGLVDPLLGMYGHAAVWGDIDGDHRPDLFVGTFADREDAEYQMRGATGRAPDRLLLAGDSAFSQDQALPDMFSRTSGGAVADLDNDGDLDLVVSRNWDDDMTEAPWTGVLRNDDGTLVPAGEGLPTTGFGGRSVGVLDYDADGMADLFIANDEGGSVLLRNEGGLAFSDATAAAGLPTDVSGLGVGIADLTGDRRADIFVAGANRLFVSDAASGFREADSAVFQWQVFGDEDLITGVSIADVNRDGMLDLAIGHHYNSTVDDGALVPVRLYLNRGTDGSANPTFEDVTDAAGLTGLPTKAPHIELNDFDNDGWPDILTTASAGDGTAPAIFRSEGGDMPTFAPPAGVGSLQYWVAGPTGDVDRDGRLDVFLVEFEPSLPSLLLVNESASGHWLEVSVGPEHGFGIGWRVDVYPAGSEELLGAREITVTQGYSAGVAPIAHFGLGDEETVDVVLTPPGGGDVVNLEAVAADQHLRFPAGCG